MVLDNRILLRMSTCVHVVYRRNNWVALTLPTLTRWCCDVTARSVPPLLLQQRRNQPTGEGCRYLIYRIVAGVVLSV